MLRDSQPTNQPNERYDTYQCTKSVSQSINQSIQSLHARIRYITINRTKFSPFVLNKFKNELDIWQTNVPFPSPFNSRWGIRKSLSTDSNRGSKGVKYYQLHFHSCVETLRGAESRFRRGMQFYDNYGTQIHTRTINSPRLSNRWLNIEPVSKFIKIYCSIIFIVLIHLTLMCNAQQEMSPMCNAQVGVNVSQEHWKYHLIDWLISFMLWAKEVESFFLEAAMLHERIAIKKHKM